MLAALAAMVVAGAVHSSVGFGFAIVAAPVLAAGADPASVPATLAIVGLLVNLLVLGGERRVPEVLARPAALLTAWSLPGLVAGALVLMVASADVLRVLVALAVLGAVGANMRGRRMARAQRATATAAGTAVAGTVSGALAASTGLNGPPLVLHLLGRSTPAQMRDTLAAIFVASGVLTIMVLAVAGTFDPDDELPALAGAAAAGWLLGRWGFARLGERHEAASLAVLALGAALALWLALRALV